MTETPKGLSKDEQARIAQRQANRAIDATLPVASAPTAVLTGGQPGAGKSTIVQNLVAEFGDKGGIVTIDPDKVRPMIPYMRPLIAMGVEEIPDVANSDAGAIAYQMVWHATAARRNVLIDGTLKNTNNASSLVSKLRSQGYTVELHGMAVYPGLSHARTYARREDEMANSPSGFGRKVDDAYHDDAVRGFAHTVEVFYEGQQVDRIALYDELGQRTYDARLQGNAWIPQEPLPNDVLDQAHTSPGESVLKLTADAWTITARAMRERGASGPERAVVEQHAARTTLQAVRAALPGLTEDDVSLAMFESDNTRAPPKPRP